MRRNTEDNKKKFLQAYYNNLCNISKTCEAIGIGRMTLYQWLDADPEFKQAVEDKREALFDDVEHELLKKVKAGDITAIIWFTKTKMKSRGYVERTENEQLGNIGIAIERVITQKVPEIEHKEIKAIEYEEN